MNLQPRPPLLLTVSEDATFAASLNTYLLQFGFAAQAAQDAAAMRAQLAMQRFDMLLLDLLPRPPELLNNAMALAHEVSLTARTPYIVFGGRGDSSTCIAALDSGAVDYLGKPFEPRELVARMRNVLRRIGPAAAAQRADDKAQARWQTSTHMHGHMHGHTHAQLHAQPASRIHSQPNADADTALHFDGWVLQTLSRRLTSPSGELVALSSAEFRLLHTFLRSPQRLLSRAQLMTQTQGRELDPVARSIDLLVSRLRHKLGYAADDTALIRTVRGQGYVMDARPQLRPVAGSMASSGTASS